MKKIINKTHFEGYLFSHNLELRTAGEQAKSPGTEFIMGTVEIATDDEGLNVVPVNYTYVTAVTKKGKKNATFGTLKTLIESKGSTWQDAGNQALKLKVDTALGINDFYNAEEELVTYKRNDGGFIHIVNAFSADRNSFEVDMLITSTVLKEADEEKDLPEVVIVKGYTFNFMNSILPIDLVVKNPDGMKYFEDLGATPAEPIFMKVWGEVACSTVETQTTEDSSFGEAKVNISVRRLREWVITGASSETYEYNDEATITKAELTEAIQGRETHLADVKQRHDDYVASKGGAKPAGGAPKAADKDFKF